MAQELGAVSSESNRPKLAKSFKRVKKILDEIDCSDYFKVFENNELTDDTLQYAATRKEMQDLLKEIVTLGIAFKFSARWFCQTSASECKVLAEDSGREGHEIIKIPKDEPAISEGISIISQVSEVTSHALSASNSSASSSSASSVSKSSFDVPTSRKIPPEISPKSTAVGNSPLETNSSTAKLEYVKESLQNSLHLELVSTNQKSKTELSDVNANFTSQNDVTSILPKKMPGELKENSSEDNVKSHNSSAEFCNSTQSVNVVLPIKNSSDLNTSSIIVNESRESVNKNDEIIPGNQPLAPHNVDSDKLVGKKNKIEIGDLSEIPIPQLHQTAESSDRTDSKDLVEHKRKFCGPQEKEGKEQKEGVRGLRDLYTVKKNEQWDDPVVRTCGESSKVKNIDIEKQIREPLAEKYNEFSETVGLSALIQYFPDSPVIMGDMQGNQEMKHVVLKNCQTVIIGDGTNITSENQDNKKKQPEFSPENLKHEDIQMYSTRVRESLHGLNFKEIGYILIANKVPLQYRGTGALAFLQSLPWIAVFDLFDPKSREDGLYYILNETTDAALATVKDLSEFKNTSCNDDLPTRGTTWIERKKEMQESNWTRISKDCLYRALSAYKERSTTTRIHCVFLVLSAESIQEMADIIECSFSIIGTKAGKSISIISEKKEIVDEIVKCSKKDVRKDVREQSIFGYSWKLLETNFKEMIGPAQSNPRDTTTELPFVNGQLKSVLTSRLNSLSDLEVYCPKPNFDNSVEQIQRARENFYKGGVVSQLNLFHNDDIERTLRQKLSSFVDQCLKRLSQGSDEIRCNVEIVKLRYESGSGATTLCRRILWNKRNTYRCAIVKAIGEETAFQIETLQSFLYEADMPYTPPILILVDNFPDQDVRQLSEKISERKKKCVMLNTVPISTPQEATDLELGQLDITEIQRTKQVLANVTVKDEERRSAAEKVLVREKRFIWMGLELFGRKYQSIEPRLSNHIDGIMMIISQNRADESKNPYAMILRFCCLLDYYSNGRCCYPHACATDILYDDEEAHIDRSTNYIELLHDTFGGLLLETYDESKGFRGWRPAHYLVGEVVRKRMHLLESTKELLTKMNDGTCFAKTFLVNYAITICLDRETKSVDTNNQDDPDDETIVIDDMLGLLEQRTKYSRLIEDVMRLTGDRKQDMDKVLDILLTLTQNVEETRHKARAWQQIARVVAYEIGMTSISNEDLQMKRINTLLRPDYQSRDSSTKGFEIAHLMIDEAIRLQDTNVHHLVTKGAFFMAELQTLVDAQGIVQKAINTGKKGIDAYESALSKMSYDSHGFLDAMVGKFQAVVRLLEFFKRLPYFSNHKLGPDESFKAYMNSEIHLDELKAVFDEDELAYIVSLKTIAVDLAINLFEEIHFSKLRRSQLAKKYVHREIRNANTRALNLTKTLYQLTRLNLAPAGYIRKGGFQEESVYHILSQRNETPFSSWKELTEDDAKKIYQMLEHNILKEQMRNASMLVCARAALHLQEKPSVNDLIKHVKLWCKRYPKSVWSHLFNYMLHFPLPNNSLNTDVQEVKDSIVVCIELSNSRKGHRRSGAEYLLGKGIGLNAIIRPYEVNKNSIDDMYGTKFWQGDLVFKKLERLQGRKISGRKGFLSYKGIEIIFDNQRYPKDSSDDLWFCLGFTLNGPYAYDPIDKDSYNDLKTSFSGSKFAENVQTSSSAECLHPSSPCLSESSRSKKAFKLAKPEAFSSIPDAASSSKTQMSVIANVRKTSSASADSEQTTKALGIQSRQRPLESKAASTGKKMQPRGEIKGSCPSSPCLSESSRSKKAFKLAKPEAFSSIPDAASSSKTQMSVIANVRKTSSASADSEQTTKTLGIQSRQRPLESKAASTGKKMQPRGEIKGSCPNSNFLTIYKRTKGGLQISFPVTHVDNCGRVLHGASVQRTPKSAECRDHLSGTVPQSCTFAHSWKGDTLQWVCTKCTGENKDICNFKTEHDKYIYDLGCYRNSRNEVWIRMKPSYN